MTTKIESNSQWDELTALTKKLLPEFGGMRGFAFNAACKQRPDLANAAIDPTGQAVIAGSNTAPKLQPTESANATGTAQPWSAVLKSLGCFKEKSKKC
jgi:hypothetical protein